MYPLFRIVLFKIKVLLFFTYAIKYLSNWFVHKCLFMDNVFFFIDARERFYYFMILLVVALRNLTEYEWNFGKRKKKFFY